LAHSGILHEDLEFMKHPKLQVFEPDYANGKGIFIRGLIHVSVAEPGNPFAAFIKQNASAVWCNRPDKDTNHLLTIRMVPPATNLLSSSLRATRRKRSAI
jgi:hypothetical protein